MSSIEGCVHTFFHCTTEPPRASRYFALCVLTFAKAESTTRVKDTWHPRVVARTRHIRTPQAAQTTSGFVHKRNENHNHNTHHNYAGDKKAVAGHLQIKTMTEAVPTTVHLVQDRYYQ